MGEAYIAKRLNDLFGAGFVSLADLHDRLAADVFQAWAAYVIEYDRLAAERTAQAEHDDVMKQAAKAAR